LLPSRVSSASISSALFTSFPLQRTVGVRRPDDVRPEQVRLPPDVRPTLEARPSPLSGSFVVSQGV
jgi:hypothetical protein